VPRRRILRLLALTGAGALLLAAVLAIAGPGDGLLHLAPALLLVLPLVAGRYVGEEHLVALVATRRPGRLPRPAKAIAARATPAPRALVARGGLLLAAALAERGPPVAPAR
jgi:hypothetical protein